MFGTWCRSPWFPRDLRLIGGRVQMPLGETPGADGLTDDDATAHPDYDVDLNAGGEDDDPSRQPPAAPAGRQPVQAPARQPGQQPPVAGAPGPDGGTPQTYTAEQYSQVVTGYRTLHTQNAELRGQLQLIQNQVAALTGLRPATGPGAAGQTPQLSESDQKAVAAVYRLFPGLKDLLEKAPDLLQLPETVKGYNADAQTRWQDMGTRMWEAFDVEVKAAYGNRQIHAFAKQSLDAAFVSWLETDKNAAARYRTGDTGLAKEFMRMYRNGVIVPAQQAGAPGAQPPGPPRRPGQVQQQPRVPRGGAGAAPVGQQPGQPNVQSAEQLHEAAADAYFAARG